MRSVMATMSLTLLILGVGAVIPALAAENLVQEHELAATGLPAGESSGPATTGLQGGKPAAAESPSPGEPSPVVEQGGEPAAGSATESQGASTTPPPPADETAAEETEPVTGAFGIPLGEPFDPCMVERVISEEETTYRGPDNTERTGTLYRVVPKTSNVHFTSYAVQTTNDGIIYAVHADYEPAETLNTCDVTRRLAGVLEEKYGKPRGKGAFGEWYSFRDRSVEHYRGIRLYANRCRRGIYSIVYSDDMARIAGTPPAPEPTGASGL